MKKTIITAACSLILASGAFADSALTLDSAVLKVSDYDNATLTYTGAFTTNVSNYYQGTLLLVLDWDKIPTSVTNNNSPQWLADFRTEEATTTASTGVGLRGWTTSGNTDKISGNTMWETSGNNRQATAEYLNNYVKDGKIALTLVLQGHVNPNTGAYLYASDGTDITTATDDALRASNTNYDTLVINNDFKNAIDSIYVFDSALTADEVKGLSAAALSAAAVPEPATATLSLLALAGLAARRRRK